MKIKILSTLGNGYTCDKEVNSDQCYRILDLLQITENDLVCKIDGMYVQAKAILWEEVIEDILMFRKRMDCLLTDEASEEEIDGWKKLRRHPYLSDHLFESRR